MTYLLCNTQFFLFIFILFYYIIFSCIFYDLNRYDTQSIIGYNCRFLQGAESDAREIYRLKIDVERGNLQEILRTIILFSAVLFYLIFVIVFYDF